MYGYVHDRHPFNLPTISDESLKHWHRDLKVYMKIGNSAATKNLLDKIEEEMLSRGLSIEDN